MNKIKWWSKIKPWYVLIYLTLLILVLISSFLEYKARHQEILHLLQDQASATATAIAHSGSEQARLSEDLKTSYIHRALDVLQMIDRLDRDGLIHSKRLEEMVSEGNVFRINIFDESGVVIASAGMSRKEGQGQGRGRGRGMGFGFFRRLEPIIQGEIDTLVLGLGGGRWWGGEKDPSKTNFLVAIRRSLGGAVTCHLTVQAEEKFRTSTNFQKIMKEMLTMEGVKYLVLNPEVNDATIISDDKKIKKSLLTLNRDAMRDNVYWVSSDSINYIEVSKTVRLGSDENEIRIGFATDHLDNLKKRMLTQIIIRSGLLTLLAIALFAFILSQYDIDLLRGEKERIEKEVHRLEKVNIQKEKQAAMGGLAAGVAHEIRNPLNAIKILSQRIKREFHPKSDESEYHEMTNTMVSEIDRINNILEDYLSYSRPIPLKFESFVLNDIIKEIELLYQEPIKIKGIKLDVSVADKITINGDRKYLKQAIANLIKNAIEATSKNEKISLFAAETAKNVLINITDTGCGITQNNLSKVFDLFYSSKDMGTGLGLAITHKIITDHLGTLEVESELNKGTTFTITLPKEMT